MKKLIAFDLDGTLVDSIEDIAAAMNRSLTKMGLSPHDTAAYDRMVGDGMKKLCLRALPEDQKERLPELIALYRADYLENCCVKTKPYPGILGLLKALKREKKAIAVISNKPQEQTERVVRELFGTEIFDWVIGQSAAYPPKPNPTVFEALLKKFDYAAEEAIYIGDSDVDMQFGRGVGVDTVGAAWGFRGEEELRKAGAWMIAPHAEALKEILFR